MKATRFRWVIVLLLFIITIINYVDRSAISYAISDISSVFHLNDAQSGMILGAFAIGYMITTFFGGIWVDHTGARTVLTISSLLWTLSIGLTGVAVGFVMIYLMRILLGIAEGPNFPAMNRAVAEWLSKDERAIALSNSLVSVPLALAIGAPVATQLIIHLSWRGMFIVLGIVGLIWVPFWYGFFRNRPEQSAHVNEAELRHIHDGNLDSAAQQSTISHRPQVTGLWKYLLTSPTLLANDWAFFVFGYYLFFFMTWLPSYLQQQYHLKLATVGLFGILPWLLAAVLLWLLGYVSDAILRRTGRLRLARSHPIWITMLLAAVCILPVIYTHNLTVALIFISLAVGFAMSSNSTFYAVNVDIAKERTGTALGVMDTFFAIAGFAAPVITGWVVNSTGQYTNAFWLLFILALSAVVAVFFFHKPDRENLERIAQGQSSSVH
ncbi:MFS transporter [Alicyclobacillus cycloheptanicus]|uniref:Sugar phosphate permease n=1 Tax=Alicyclobacillus cycloheptanicus TaxID=1457 RepID=A0ABT9XNA0_9BACL|nr:MFS transporter [Alicyclobacillus cycloheptanicus]MDQ0191176.1 sugar phosphate permease [Alicyclobacillus cycloheptanicus]